MKAPLLVVCVSLGTALPASAQAPVGALAIDERRGDQWGWAVDYETTAAARETALRECGSGCSVVLTFERCGAYAMDQDADSTAVGWAESYDSGASARQAALAECRSRGGSSGCIVRVWGCNGPVVEEELGLDRAARRQIQQGLRSAGFDPGGADGLFGPRTRAAIRRWQSSRGTRSTGYLDGASAGALRTAVGSAPPPPPSAGAPAASPAATAAQENLFWQSVMSSTNPAEFEAYLAQFPNGVFRALALARLAALRASSNERPSAAGTRVGGAGSLGASGSQVSGAAAPAFSTAAAGDARWRPGEVFRDCAECPEMVVMPGGHLALGRYEVTVGEYRTFASATTGGAGDGCLTFADGDSSRNWRNPGVPQTERHPVTCVSWDAAQEYVSWLSRTTGEKYRLPTEAEWERAAAGSVDGCGLRAFDEDEGACPVGASVANSVGLFDMVGNLWEWTEGCWEGDCGRRVLRGGSSNTLTARSVARSGHSPGVRVVLYGFRVSRTLD